MKKKAFAAICMAMSLALTLMSCGGRGGRPVEADPEGRPAATNYEDRPSATAAPEETTTEATEPVNETNPEDFGYIRVEGGIAVYGYGGDSEEVIIPSEIDGKPVVCIGHFKEETHGIWGNMKSVVIPEGVTTLSPTAFYDCETLENITFPSTLVNIETHYYNNKGLFLTPFHGTAWLEKKREEDPLVIVNNFVVDGRTCTRRVEIPEGVTHIAAGAFEDCTTVTSFTLPESLESIGERAFEGCSRLEKIVIPENVSVIGDYAFLGCDILADITLPERPVDIGYGVFNKSRYGIWIKWMENKLEENPVVIVGSNLICVEKGYYYDNDDDVPEYFVVPDNIQSIAGGAFEHADGIKGVQLPDGIKKLSNYIFDSCDFESITIPESVTEIGNGAFMGCDDLKSITIPEGVTKIGNRAFAGCLDLESLTLPDGLEYLGEDAFDCDVFYKGEIYYPELHGELQEEINGA